MLLDSDSSMKKDVEVGRGGAARGSRGIDFEGGEALESRFELRDSPKRNGTSSFKLHISLSSVDDSDEESDPAEDTSAHEDVASSSSGSIKQCQ